MALATVAQVEAILGEDLDATAEARVTVLIGLVQESIEDELGRPAEAATITDEVHTAGRISSALLLDNWPVAAVTTVTERGTALTEGTDYVAELDTGRLTRIAGTTPDFYPTNFAWAHGGVVVTYDTATIGQLATLCAQIVARTFLAGRNQSAAAAIAGGVMQGIRQLTIGRWSATADTTESSNPVASMSLSDADRAIIRRWRDRRP